MKKSIYAKGEHPQKGAWVIKYIECGSINHYVFSLKGEDKHCCSDVDTLLDFIWDNEGIAICR